MPLIACSRAPIIASKKLRVQHPTRATILRAHAAPLAVGIAALTSAMRIARPAADAFRDR